MAEAMARNALGVDGDEAAILLRRRFLRDDGTGDSSPVDRPRLRRSEDTGSPMTGLVVPRRREGGDSRVRA